VGTETILYKQFDVYTYAIWYVRLSLVLFNSQ